MLYKKGLAALVAVVSLIACSNSLWDEVPAPIESFVSTYFPMEAISHYDVTKSHYYVTIKDGATLVFDSDYQWTDVNGNGSTIPETFVTNELPEELVVYLASQALTNSVYSAHESGADISLEMINYTIDYNSQTHVISQP